MLDCEFIATGHYANIRKSDETGRYVVSKGLDTHKDQSYVLWGSPNRTSAAPCFLLAVSGNQKYAPWLWKWGRPNWLKKVKAMKSALSRITITGHSCAIGSMALKKR